MKNIIVTGGAGYIGKTVCMQLKKNGFNPIIIDRSARKKIKKKIFTSYNLNISKIDRVLKKHPTDTLIHCASNNVVWDSKNNPQKYYKTNVSDTIDMLCKCVDLKIKNIIYASSSSVYGNPKVKSKIDEKHNISPNSCYGRTKKINEDIIIDFADAYNLNYIFLRLFNVSGAITEKNFKNGPTKDSTAAIARAINMIKSNKRNLTYFISTSLVNKKDNTPIRDFVHVEDVAQAFLKSLIYLKKNKKSEIFNIGSGSEGISVYQLLNKINLVLKKKLNFKKSNKLKENIHMVVPNIGKAKKLLKYRPLNSSLKNIIKTLDEWYEKKD